MTKTHLYGVNLGGWLVLEKWMTPSVFAGTSADDEYGFMQTKNSAKKIDQHRKTFITEQDFRWMAENGVEIVRIPVGYWVFTAQDGYEPAVKYLDWAMDMAEKHGIKVLIDLHAAPGSQNEGDHSGQYGPAHWFEDKSYQDQTLAVIEQLAKRYGHHASLWGIEVLNEPHAKGSYWMLLRFYRRAYRVLRRHVRPGIYTVFHDGFRPLLFSGALWPKRGFPVAMDVHWYAFSIGKFSQLDSYMRYAALYRRVLLKILRMGQPVIVGEWSTVLPQSVFDAVPQHLHTDLLRQNAAVQQRVYGAALGQMYWNYKVEGRGMWHFRSLVEDGVINTSQT
jgi:glucan 1,3-beta-glucosidase